MLKRCQQEIFTILHFTVFLLNTVIQTQLLLNLFIQHKKGKIGATEKRLTLATFKLSECMCIFTLPCSLYANCLKFQIEQSFRCLLHFPLIFFQFIWFSY